MLTVTTFEDRTITVGVECDTPCCERPPCAPLTMGRQVEDLERLLVVMAADSSCYFRYMVEFKGCGVKSNLYFEHLGSQCFAINHSKYQECGGWPTRLGWLPAEVE